MAIRNSESNMQYLKSRYCLDSQAEKAKLASKARLCLRTPKAMCSSFLIAAQTICIGVLPFFLSRSANSLMILLCCFATIAGKYNARLIRALPSFDKFVCFRLVPDCLFLGVTPAWAAIERAEL